MNESQRKPGVTFWATIVLTLVLVAYPLSWGPVLWPESSGNFPESLIWADRAYDPIRWILSISPDAVGETWNLYLMLWASNAKMPYYNAATGSWE